MFVSIIEENQWIGTPFHLKDAQGMSGTRQLLYTGFDWSYDLFYNLYSLCKLPFDNQTNTPGSFQWCFWGGEVEV